MSQHVNQDDDTELGPPDASLATTVLRNYRYRMDGRPLDEHTRHAIGREQRGGVEADRAAADNERGPRLLAV